MFFFKKLAVLTFIEIGYLGSVRALVLRVRGGSTAHAPTSSPQTTTSSPLAKNISQLLREEPDASNFGNLFSSALRLGMMSKG